MWQHRPATCLPGQTGTRDRPWRRARRDGQSPPDRRRQATPGREDDVKDALLAAPIREHMDELAIDERLPANMVGQERDAKAGSRSHAHGREIATAHAWFVAHYLAHAVLALK